MSRVYSEKLGRYVNLDTLEGGLTGGLNYDADWSVVSEYVTDGLDTWLRTYTYAQSPTGPVIKTWSDWEKQ